MKASAKTTAERVTVSLPRDLFEWGEGERRRTQVSRSQFVADLYRRYRGALEERRRVARYAAAYGKVPATDTEDYLTERSGDVLFGDAD
jgi:metal-responsive CopG/Arc/MetJ family transcriptional regulator